MGKERNSKNYSCHFKTLTIIYYETEGSSLRYPNDSFQIVVFPSSSGGAGALGLTGL